MKFKPTTFRPWESGARRALGDLESEIMECMWSRDAASVRDVCAVLSGRELAYTTIMTVMGRLASKGLLEKEKQGKQFIYSAALTRDEFENSISTFLLAGLTGTLGSSVLASFVEGIEEDSVLEELEDLIREKRRQGGSQ